MKKQQSHPLVTVKSRCHLLVALTITLSFASCWNNALACGCFDAIWACLFSNTNDLTYDLDDDGDGYETPTELQTPAQDAAASSVAITIASKEPQQLAQRKSPQQQIADPSGVIISDLNGHLFLTTPRPCKTLRGEDDKLFNTLPLQLLEGNAVKSWYANQCANTTLSKLIDTTIACIEICEQDRKKVAQEKPNIVIFDIDATIFSEYEAECFIAQNRESLSADKINEIHIQVVTDIAPVHALYTYFKDNKYPIAFVSSRTEATRETTTTLLLENGYTVSDNNLFLRNDPLDNMAAFKASVRKCLAAYYTLFANVDDDYMNLCGPNGYRNLCGPNSSTNDNAYISRYNVWVPNVLRAQKGEAAFYAYLTTNLVFPADQSNTKPPQPHAKSS